MKTTDAPVKILLADGIDQTGTGTMEQLSLVHCLPSISLLHLSPLPRITGKKYVLEAEGTYCQMQAT